nr:arsenic resistance N-acetyltransferase ArsN2 [Rhizomicrobium palustre]
MKATIYHNPDCGTSRNTLALLRHFGVLPHVVEYLKTPPSRAEIEAILAKAGLSLRQILRKKGTPYAELGLDAASDDALFEAIAAHPILLNRPLVVTGKGAALSRPSDVVLDLLPMMPGIDLNKEDGAPFLRDVQIGGDDAGLIAALHDEKLALDDLREPNRRFFVYRTLSGAVLGYGGYELYGADVFLRSIVVLSEARGKKIGRNIVPLLMYRAYREGAKTAWLLTTTASDFFEKNGFSRKTREDAPQAILQTRQAKSLCPASATLLSKKISF